MAVPYAEVIGNPIGHSKSPLIHKFWLERLGVEGDYRAARVMPESLPAYLSDRRSDPDWRGCNVTMPLKMQMVPHLSYLNDGGRRLGAVNCIAPRPSGLWGTNFDSTALVELLAPLQSAGHAILVGSGGAARAALWALHLKGFKQITVLARDAAKARQMIDVIGVEARIAPMSSPIEGDMLINATPLGMTGYPPLNVTLDGMPNGSTVLDMVYDPVDTPLSDEARRRGFRTIDGLDMLMEQAAMSFTTFFNAAPDRTLRDELRALLTS